MAGVQFIHVEGYGKEGSKLKGAKRAGEGTKRGEGSGGWSASEILAEALRELDASSHVPSPKPPVVLFGNLESIKEDIDNLPEKRPGMRKDTPVLLAGVMSAPWPPGDPRSNKWQEDGIKHVIKKFGDNLKAVISHTDEEYDHMHFFVTLPDYVPTRTIHPGLIARKLVKDAGGTPKEETAGYNTAMSKWQDMYSLEVGIANGQTRLGPARQRLTREEWRARQDDAEHTAMALQVIAQAQESAKSAADDMTLRAMLLKSEAQAAAEAIEMEALSIRIEATNHAQVERSALQKIKDELQAQRTRQDTMLEDLKKAHVFNKNRADQLERREVFLEERRFEVDKKSIHLDGLLSDFYATMANLHKRMTQIDKVAIEHLLSAVDKIKACFTGATTKEKTRSGLDIDQ